MSLHKALTVVSLSALFLGAAAACRNGATDSSTKAIVGTDESGAKKALGLLYVYNTTDVTLPSANGTDLGVNYAVDLAHMPQFALVETTAYAGLDEEQWMWELEFRSKIGDLDIHPDRSLWITNKNGKKTPVPARVVGTRLLTYSVMNEVFDQVQTEGDNIKEETYALAQAVYLGMRGSYSSKQPNSASPLLTQYLMLGRMQWNVSDNDMSDVKNRLLSLDYDMNPCVKTGQAVLPAKVQQWKTSHFSCVPVVSQGTMFNYKPGGTSSYPKVRDMLASKIASLFDTLYPQKDVAKTKNRVLWNIVTSAESWASATFAGNGTTVARYLAGKQAGFDFSGYFTSAHYGDPDNSSLSLTDGEPATETVGFGLAGGAKTYYSNVRSGKRPTVSPPTSAAKTNPPSNPGAFRINPQELAQLPKDAVAAAAGSRFSVLSGNGALVPGSGGLTQSELNFYTDIGSKVPGNAYQGVGVGGTTNQYAIFRQTDALGKGMDSYAFYDAAKTGASTGVAAANLQTWQAVAIADTTAEKTGLATQGLKAQSTYLRTDVPFDVADNGRVPTVDGNNNLNVLQGLTQQVSVANNGATSYKLGMAMYDGSTDVATPGSTGIKNYNATLVDGRVAITDPQQIQAARNDTIAANTSVLKANGIDSNTPGFGSVVGPPAPDTWAAMDKVQANYDLAKTAGVMSNPFNAGDYAPQAEAVTPPTEAPANREVAPPPVEETPPAVESTPPPEASGFPESVYTLTGRNDSPPVTDSEPKEESR